MKRRTYVLWKKALLYLLVFTVIFGAGYVYFRTSTFTIHDYRLEGLDEVQSEKVNEILHDYESRRLYKILPGNRTISFHHDEIITSIRDAIPTAESISVRPVTTHTIRVRVTHYVPLFRVGNGQAITKDGIVYTEIQNIDELPILSVATTSKATPGVLSKIADLVPKISTALFAVRAITVDEYHDIYLLGGEYREHAVILSSYSDTKKVWSNIVSAIDTDPLKTKLKTTPHLLEYLDTRFGNKVFFKFSPLDNKSEIITSTSSSQ